MRKLEESHQENVAGKESYTARLSRRIDTAYEAYKAGEGGSEERLYDALLAQANNVVWYRLRTDPYDPALGRDIAHRGMMALKQFQGISKPSTWFYRIAQNAVNDAIRSLKENRDTVVPFPSDEPDDESSLPPIAAHETNGDAAFDLERLRQVLPEEQDEVISQAIEGYTVNEIAAKTGMRRATAGSRLRLAIRKMKGLLKKNGAVR